jgi:hypothetical protein
MGLPAWGISLIIGGGSMALQYLLAPKVKQEPVDKGKLDNIAITGSEYGAFIRRIWGKARVPGDIIFSSGVVHTIINTPSGGGKGVPQAPATRTHIYTSSLGILICRRVNNFLRTWADADLILGNGEFSDGQFEAEDATLSGGAHSASDAGASGGEYVTALGSGGKAVFNFTSIPDPPFPGVDPDEINLPYTRISFFYKCSVPRSAVVKCTVDGTDTITTEDFAATGTDWTTYTMQASGFVDTLEFANAGATAPDLDLITIEKYYIPIPTEPLKAGKYQPTFNITGNVNQNIIYPKNIDDPSEYYNAPLIADGDGKIAVTPPIPSEATRYYKGTTTQTQDSAIIQWLDARYGTGEGVLRCPAHRGTAYVVFENRRLKQARTENFTFEVDCGDNNVNDVLEDLFADVGIESGDYDLTATSALSMVGFVEHTKSSRRALVEYLERYHFFRIAEIDGKIKTVLDSTTSIATISANLLRAHNYGEDAPRFDGEIAIKEENLFPREVRVSVMNPDIEYHNESVMAQLFASLSSTENKEYTFPIVDDGDTARAVAEKLLLKEHSEDKAIEFFGMPEMAKYSVGDVLTVPFGGLSIKLRIEKKQMALPLGKIRFQAVAVNPFTPTYYQTDFTSLAPMAQQQFATFNFPRNSVVIPILSEPLNAKERGKLGVYLAVTGRGRGAAENIGVYREFDDDNYILQYVNDVPAVAGLGANDLEGHADPETEDTTSELDIWFFDEIELESVLQADIDRYPQINLLRVGDEWLQFRTATAQTLEENSPYRSKWRVSNLWRGRFGTAGAVDEHGEGEYCVLYTSAVKFFELDRSDIGEDITFKAVTNGQAEENGQTETFTFDPVSAYTVTNGTADRTFDADNTSINELADVVATVIDDLNL